MCTSLEYHIQMQRVLQKVVARHFSRGSHAPVPGARHTLPSYEKLVNPLAPWVKIRPALRGVLASAFERSIHERLSAPLPRLIFRRRRPTDSR